LERSGRKPSVESSSRVADNLVSRLAADEGKFVGMCWQGPPFTDALKSYEGLDEFQHERLTML